MCGIAGIVSPDRVDLRSCTLTRMHGAIGHRGPDDSGSWCSPNRHAAFAHTRLSILDPTPAGHQPMGVADARFTITYNGEIYNFAELRASLTASGVTFRSNSDTEVILRLYERYGSACVERLRGMFAFAIWDEGERTCFLARDRFGIKPLYYREARGELTFASEVRALVAGGVPRTIDAGAAYHYFRTGSVPEPLTLVREVRALEAGHYMVWRDGRLAIHRYWDVAFPATEGRVDAVAAARDALLDSVTHHFVSDVPVGVFLSGGIDSTAIVALARQQRAGELRTFSLSFPGSPLDEGGDARRTAEHFQTTHHEWAIDGITARKLFEEFLTAADQPSIDGFNTFTASRFAQQHATKVVLSGLGGDELFGGYPSFQQVPRLAQLGRLARMGGPVTGAALAIARQFGDSRVRRLGDLVASPVTLETAYTVFRGIYTRDEARALTRHYIGSEPPIEAEAATPSGDPTDADGVSRLELTRYMRNQLLRDSDVMSMASGVELRVPFVDSVLFERLSRVPASQRLSSRKALLRAAVPEIPEWVTRRPKRGFTLPLDRWFKHEWAGTIREVHSPPGVHVDTWYRQLAVLAFEEWRGRLAAAQHD
jgi:asparagine synthase (glutamine-hydrolysing)